MKKILAITLLIILALGALAGCGKTVGSQDTDGKASGTVVTAGSTSVQPLSEELAAAFMDANQGITVEVQREDPGRASKPSRRK
jgi:phosphate transport system substrate-binding protein